MIRLLYCVSLTVSLLSGQAQDLPKLAATLEDVRVSTTGKRLTVQTEALERSWQWTGRGLVTVSLKNRKTGKQWADGLPAYGADWTYFGWLDTASARLITLTARPSDDEKFTSRHLAITAEVAYPAQRCTVRYEVWAYPHAPGLLTRVWFKGTPPVASASKAVATGPTIRPLTGRNENPYLAQAKAARWFSTQAFDAQALQYQFARLDPKKQYLLGGSWWDWNGAGRSQRIRLTSMDGEIDEPVIGPTDLARSAAPQSFSALLPTKVLSDNTARLYVDKLKGPDAALSELWLYEKTDRNSSLPNGDEDRLDELAKQAPPGYRLVAYYDCGEPMQNEKLVATGRVDYVPLRRPGKQVRFVGYYNDTQHRNSPDTPILREEKTLSTTSIANRWASLVSVEQADQGLVMVKESHKCANQYGVDTGEFRLDDAGLANTGTSLFADDWNETEYQWAWASWTLVYTGGDDYRELAVKQFDRLRYPTRMERDMYALTCTWGHSLDGRDGRNYAQEKNILPEIDRTADLGIDLLLIDDGWQVNATAPGAQPDSANGWAPHPEVYPDGWRNVVARQQKTGLELGLWGIAREMPLSAMQQNWDQLRFKQLKLDFASFPNHGALDRMMRTVRQFITYTNHQSIISWDVTENAPRYGYFWAREYGNVHLANRKPEKPVNTVYVPWLALRDYWQLARYANLNKFQLTIQNPEVINRAQSDAYRHSPAYCAATGLMGVPEFMALPRFYSPAARDSIRKLLQTYRKHRAAIWNAFVFPVGDVPSNRSYSGFQAYHPGSREGYFLLFRELYTKQAEVAIPVRFLAGRRIKITDLQTGKATWVTVSKAGKLPIHVPDPANFQFLKYSW